MSQAIDCEPIPVTKLANHNLVCCTTCNFLWTIGLGQAINVATAQMRLRYVIFFFPPKCPGEVGEKGVFLLA